MALIIHMLILIMSCDARTLCN